MKSIGSVYMAEALEQEKCPICYLNRKAEHDYIFWFLYEKVNDSGIRSMWRQSGGFCHKHSWSLHDVASEPHCAGELGVAILYKDLIENVFLANSTQKRKREECFLCAMERDVESRNIDFFIKELEDEDFREKYSGSHGLCIPHFFMILSISDDRGKAFLEGVQKNRMEDLFFRLSEYIRKHDYRFSHEFKENERNSWKDAIRLFAGERNERD